MSLRLTPEMLAGAYDFLCTTEPFKAWKLPESDDAAFYVVADPNMFADFLMEGDMPRIRVSVAKNGQINTLMATISHELIHMRQHYLGLPLTHNAFFRRQADRVCRAHGYDIKTF